MIIDFNKIKNISTEFYRKTYKYGESHHLNVEVGEHYKLLTFLTNSFDDILILDVGTNWGESAVALSQNKKNKVITYDITTKWPQYVNGSLIEDGSLSEFIDQSVDKPYLNQYKNLEFRMMDIANESDEVIKSSKMIFLDIAHDGDQERSFTDRLERIGFKGLLFCDDIFSPDHPNMKPWWESITREKYDLTDLGHRSGTGLVNYSDDEIIIIK
jgi:predicted O-methyltransferase YrrM